MIDIIDRLRDPKERFVFQGGSEFACDLASEIKYLRAECDALRALVWRVRDYDADCRAEGDGALPDTVRRAIDAAMKGGRP